MKNYPDDYQYERAARFGVCQKAIWQALKKLDVTYKKALRHPKANEDARQSFRKEIKALITSGKNLESSFWEKPLRLQSDTGFSHRLA